MGSGGLRTTLTALALAFAACACGTASPPPAAAPPVPKRPPAAVPAVDADYPPVVAAQPCDPRESLTPLSPMPAPGSMPPGSTMARILDRTNKKLIVGVDQNTQFFSSIDYHSRELVGFDIEMAKAVGRAIFGEDGHVGFQFITQAQRIPKLQSGEVDLVIDTFTITCARKQDVAFSGDYYDDGQRVLVPYDSTAKSIDDLAGRRVCTVRGTTSIATLRAKNVLTYAADNWTDCLVALQRGEVDAVSTTGALLGGLGTQDTDTQVVGPRFTDEPHGMAVAHGADDFVRFLNGLLTRMIADGRWQELYDTWLRTPFGKEQSGKPVSTYKG
ncbi:glutamate ABC transporter substrate-binding protein [Yinghuangia seranimata]|uniref:glutamate ABC transporter substrate-binding protein n=1 Tax=Yinghuangia seranimata TaxID=408067 RepID=UPI00248C1C4C|nr:glutamate ABC transporter substrate-binding protein [Yinghuangia seranimata]MDI2126089.1 glutamate ABC transporter substrate-binding protein [Yinghuangia seranimata]